MAESNSSQTRSPSPAASAALGRLLILGTSLLILLSAVAWFLPVDVVQSWAMERAGKDEFARFEAVGASAAVLWIVRGLSTAGGTVLLAAWIRRRKTVPALVRSIAEFWQAARPDASTGAPFVHQLRASAGRAFVLAWLVLAVYHAGTSLARRAWDWPVYRLHDGQTVLPNISDNNREVIRYLQSATPPGSRILVLSDQKLFFLSYYLLPRRLYHPTHPDSEFVIPQPYNQRQLAAYRLEDLDPDRLRRLRPDYILEYFEGSPFTEGQDLSADSSWVGWQRQRRGPGWRPSYLVRLQRSASGGTP